MTAVSRALLAALAVLVALGVLAVAGPPAAGAQGDAAERRVLVLAVPGLSWEDVNDGPVPNLRALLDDSAVASVALRVVRMATLPGEGYATLGAGTRAVANRALAGMAYGAGEPWGRRGTVADEVARQRGAPVDGEVLSVVWGQLEVQNAGSEFRARLGTLGQALADAGVDRGVVANADGDDPLSPEATDRREAVLAVADADGAVPCGDVDRGVLRDDDGAPFGVRLDPDVVLEVFRRCSTPGSVVLVEASDVRRADAYGRRLGARRTEAVRDQALQDTDALVGRLLGELDPERDAVVVVTPSVRSEPRLGVLGVRAAEYPPGLLVSGSTRQPGFVTLTDVTPTIAALAGVALDAGSLEGRTVDRSRRGGTAVERRLGLEDDDAVARFRDRLITPVAATYIAAVCLLAVGAVVVLARHRRSRLLEQVALMVLAVTPATYLARFLPLHEWGAAAYAAFVAAVSVVLGLAYRRVGGSWLRPLAVAYGVVVGVVVLSVAVLGSRLQLGSVFGDSPIVAGRFNGVNNVTYAQLIVAAIALAAIACHTWAGRRGRAAVVAILAAVTFVVAAPMWGADVGGALAGIPTLALVGARLGGWRIRLRTVLLWGAVAVAAVVVLGLVDLSRDSADQSHLARLFERIGSEGFDGFRTVVERKLAANIRSVQGSVWRFILVPVIVAAVIAVWRSPARFRGLVRAFPALAAVVPGALVGLVLGYALNDSGIAVPGMMLAVSVPAVVYLLSRVEGGDVTERTPA